MPKTVPFPVFGGEEIGIFLEVVCELLKKQNASSMDSAMSVCEEVEDLLQKVYETQGPYMLELGEEMRINLYEPLKLKGYKQIRPRTEFSTLYFSIPSLVLEEKERAAFSYKQGPKQRAAYTRLLNRSLKQKNKQIQMMFESKRFLLNFLAHELRNPLTSILNAVALIEMDPDCVKENTIPQMLKHSGNDMKRLVDEVLDFAKIEGGTLGFDIKPCSLGEVCQTFAKAAQTMVLGEGLRWSCEGLEDIGHEMVGVDEFRLRQALNNLLSNALKFTSEGAISFGAKIQGEKAVLFLKDTGKGIDEKFKAEIFEEFSQESAQISKRFGGSGLGLNICYKLIKAMDGELKFESAKGVGTIFYIELPLV